MPTMMGVLDSSLVDMLEHVEEEHRLRLLLRHVLLKVVLQCLQLQEDLQPPPLVQYARFFCMSWLAVSMWWFLSSSSM